MNVRALIAAIGGAVVFVLGFVVAGSIFGLTEKGETVYGIEAAIPVAALAAGVLFVGAILAAVVWTVMNWVEGGNE